MMVFHFADDRRHDRFRETLERIAGLHPSPFISKALEFLGKDQERPQHDWQLEVGITTATAKPVMLVVYQRLRYQEVASRPVQQRGEVPTGLFDLPSFTRRDGIIIRIGLKFDSCRMEL